MAFLKIKNLNGGFLGQVELSEDGVKFTGEYDHDFYELVRDILEEGVPVYSDKKVFPGDSLFGISFRNYLTRNGFTFYEQNTEFEDRVREFSESIPDSDPEKSELIEKLSNMSNLEQTLFLSQVEA